MARPKKTIKPQTKSNLEEIIKLDQALAPEMKSLFIAMAGDFEKDFGEHLFMSSLQLNQKHPYGLDMWQQFTTHPTISKYLSTYMNEVISKKADADIFVGSGVRDAVAVKKQLSSTSKAKDNFNFVIMFIPDEEDRVYEADALS